jgi:hypothetical protein
MGRPTLLLSLLVVSLPVVSLVVSLLLLLLRLSLGGSFARPVKLAVVNVDCGGF